MIKGLYLSYTESCYKSLKMINFPPKSEQWIGKSQGYILSSWAKRSKLKNNVQYYQ